jgi:hypothetical protein
MEIFIQGVPLNADRKDIARVVAPILHSAPYNAFSHLPMNFSVHLIKDRNRRSRHIGRGAPSSFFFSFFFFYRTLTYEL